MISNQNGILGGIEFAKETFGLIDKKIKFKNKKKDGSLIKKGEIIATIDGVEMQVPLDPANRHYAAILEWVAKGNTIQDAD